MFSELLDKDGLIFSKIFNKISESHPDVVSSLKEKFENAAPISIKLPIEKAIKLTNVDSIVYLREALQIAVELELTVMLEYLFACYSVIDSSDEVSGDSEITTKTGALAPYLSELRREYKNQLIIISQQEMQHMRKACNLLVSIGGTPNLQSVEFPSKFGVGEEKADLIRLSLKSLFLFAKNEEPFTEESANRLKIDSNTSAKEGFKFLGIGELYDAIIKGFKTIHQQIGNSMFCVEARMSVMGAHTAYTNLEDCLYDIHTIQEQGEGELGGDLYDDIIKKIIKWMSDLTIDDPQIEELKQKIIELSNQTLKETDNLVKLFPDVVLLVNLIANFETSTGTPLPFDKKDFLIEKLIEPSHWARYLMMILNFLMLMIQIGKDEDEFTAHISRPSYPRPVDPFDPKKPNIDSEYHPITKKLIDLTNTSYYVLLKILEAAIIAVPSELENSYQITERYKSIGFYPIMSILIYPLGEILSYLQLSSGKKGEKLTAGFPSIPNTEDAYISDPLDKFHDVVLTLKRLYKQSLELDKQFFNELGSCVGMWLDNKQNRKPIIDRVKCKLNHVIESIRVLYLGFTNGLAFRELKSKEVKTKIKPPKLTENVNKYYLNVEFDGYVIYSMATDKDPTFDTRGCCGHQFMFEENDDPDFTNEMFVQNTLTTKDGKLFNRDFIPDKFYKGVKCTSAKLVLPYYESEETINMEKFDKIQKALQIDFKDRDFCFSPIEIDGLKCVLRFPQLNFAITRHVGIDPIFVGFKTDQFEVKRANLIYDKNNKVVDFVTACITCSDSFGAYPMIADCRMPKCGGYLQWMDPFHKNKGVLMHTNLINSKCGAGQCTSDFYTTYMRRCAKFKVEIDAILKSHQDDFLANLIDIFLEYYPQSKLIILALMVNIPPPDINRLSYLCARYLNCVELINKNFNATPFQCFYHIPLNAPKDDKSEYFTAKTLKTGHGNILWGIHFNTDQDWYLDFWVGGMDYDALTFCMSGSLMIPITVDLGKP